MTAFGALAQLVERFVRNEEVSGSTPLSSTNPKRERPGPGKVGSGLFIGDYALLDR